MGLLNVDGYYNSLLSFIDKAVEEGFISPSARQIIVSAPTPKELVKKLEVPKCVKLLNIIQEAFLLYFLCSSWHSNLFLNCSLFIASCYRSMCPVMKELLQSQAGRWGSLATLKPMISLGDKGVTALRRRWMEFWKWKKKLIWRNSIAFMGNSFFVIM